ncbi:ComF family protein [Parasphingorhabdus sp.]|uniref:ComF family protein n=1 Tax=Parasphingorhabdus sp. TaxID=2709688 RepID=UPI0032662888
MSCLRDPPSHDGVRAAVAYSEQSAALAIRLKYGSRLGVAELMARHMQRFVRSCPDSTIIVPVPLHRTRLWSRGFNQSVLIGRCLSLAQDIPMYTDIISRKRATPPLRAMSAKERRKTVKGAFVLSTRNQHHVANNTIFLVDDVYTSGATANACAALLKSAGARQVVVLCWARVLPKSDQI